MEAPEKVYMPTILVANVASYKTEGSIEYIRTDTFIEKVCEWIETNMDDYIHVEYDTVTGMPTNEAHIAHKKVIDDFVNYMKGEYL